MVSMDADVMVDALKCDVIAAKMAGHRGCKKLKSLQSCTLIMLSHKNAKILSEPSACIYMTSMLSTQRAIFLHFKSSSFSFSALLKETV